MAKAKINRFDGGIAEDIRTTKTNECASSVNFDIASNPHKLIPYSDPVAETHASGPITDYAITDVAVLNIGGTTPTIYGIGRASSVSTNVAVFKKSSTSDITSQWSASLATGGTLAPGTLLSYYDATASLDKLYFYNGGTFSSFDTPSTITTHGALTGAWTTGLYPRPYRHTLDNSVYVGAANIVYKFDAVTYTAVTQLHALDKYFEVLTFSEYGRYLAIGGRYFGRDKRSTVYLSNKDITSPQEAPFTSIDWGEGSLVHLENMGGVLVGISYSENVGGYTTLNTYKIYIKTYSGGVVTTVKEILTNRSDAIKIWTARSQNRLYFGYDTDQALFVFGKNKLGEWYLTKDRYYNPSGSFITGTFNGVSFVGDIAFIAYQDGGTTGYLVRQGTGTGYTLPAYYTTTVNPGIKDEERELRKKLKKVRISYEVNAAGGTVGLGLRTDSQTASYTSIISKTQSSAGQYVTTASGFADGTQFDEGYEFQFQFSSTGNVSIKQVSYEYDIVND